jgi:ribosomal protein S18 acetylase RimI-like enzyme
MTIRVLALNSEHFTSTAQLFDDYRQHYGQASDPAASADWLRQRVADGLAVSVALRENRVRGFVTTVLLPASLRLGTFCSVRDVYVDPVARRAGIARAMLEHVIAEARAAGAIRVSLQTETDNSTAQSLYASLGFRRVPDLDLLTLPTTQPSPTVTNSS